MVSLPAQRPAVHADGRRCTWMYETRNETARIGPPAGGDAWPCGVSHSPVLADRYCALVMAWTQTGRSHEGSAISRSSMVKSSDFSHFTPCLQLGYNSVCAHFGSS
jgi:hypothetical protein